MYCLDCCEVRCCHGHIAAAAPECIKSHTISILLIPCFYPQSTVKRYYFTTILWVLVVAKLGAIWYHIYMKKLTSHNILTPLLIVVLSFWAATATAQYFIVKDKKQPIVVDQKETDARATIQKPGLEYVNTIRAERGLPALTHDTRLDSSAKTKAEDMVARNYYNHDDPQGRPFYRFIYASAPNLYRSGENQGRCYLSQDAVYQAYKNSPTHLANIVDPNYTVYGSAIVWDADDKCLVWVDHFGGYR